MSDMIKISVDGQDGDLVARNSGIRFVTPDDDLALVRPGESGDGRPGASAPRAIPGAPAGFLAVDLSESSITDEGITVRTLGFTSRQEPPQRLEVPARKNLVLSAKGGRAESGHTGGDGQTGMNGIDGFPATREVDATVMSSPMFFIRYHEKKLIPRSPEQMAVTVATPDKALTAPMEVMEVLLKYGLTKIILICCLPPNGTSEVERVVRLVVTVNPGREAEAETEAPATSGEMIHLVLAYLIQAKKGHIESSTSTSLVRAGSVVGTNTMALMAPMRAQAVQGGNLQAMIASVALRYGARRHERADPGSCHCKGGTGSCFGCESVPIHKDFERDPGRSGRDGRPGLGIDTPLFAGSAGHAGNATLHVRFHDSSHQQYNSCYQLELLDFDVDDENGDGIFEPGEHVFIRRIRIRNTGGMPSPKSPIPVFVVASDWFLPVSGDEGGTMITSSISPGVTVTLEGSIKVLISRSDGVSPLGSQFLRRERLSVRATMPWLNRDLPHFEYFRMLDIQYPVELRHFDFLSSVAQGSTSRFSFEMFNKSNKALGFLSYSKRRIETQISFPADFGVLLSPQNIWETQVDCHVTELRAQEFIPLGQKLRIASDAKSYQHVAIQVDLYISVPLHEITNLDNPEVEMQLIQQNDLLVQISAHHTFNNESNFLLVTNSKISRDRVQAIQRFINTELNMQMDEWNVSLYGGLQLRPETVEDPPDYVLGLYRGKTIIFMGNQFEYFDSGTRNACEICDPRILAEICVHGTGCLFLESSGQEAFQRLARTLVFPVPYRTENIFEHVKPSRNFASRSAMLESISQHIIVGGSPEVAVYTLPVKRHWYRRRNRAWPEAEAKRLAKFLRQRLPQERFLVTAVWQGTDTAAQSEIRAIILHGVPHPISVVASEAQPRSPELSPFEAFMIADSLPSSTRVDIAWSLPANESPSSPLALEAVSLSLLLSISAEIRTFLHKANWPNAIDIPTPNSHTTTTNPQAISSFLLIHLPILSQLLHHPTAQSHDPAPKHILDLLHHTLASCRPHKTRHILLTTVLPFFPHRRTTQLRNLLTPPITALLSHKTGHNTTFLAAFHRETKTLHRSNLLLLQAVAHFTRTSNHEFAQGRVSAGSVVPRTELCGPEEWDSRCGEGERKGETVRGETAGAWGVLGRMVVDEGGVREGGEGRE